MVIFFFFFVWNKINLQGLVNLLLKTKILHSARKDCIRVQTIYYILQEKKDEEQLRNVIHASIPSNANSARSLKETVFRQKSRNRLENIPSSPKRSKTNDNRGWNHRKVVPTKGLGPFCGIYRYTARSAGEGNRPTSEWAKTVLRTQGSRPLVILFIS